MTTGRIAGRRRWRWLAISAVAAVLTTAFIAPAEAGAGAKGSAPVATATTADATALAAADTADFQLACGNSLAGYTADLDAALTNQGVTNLMAQANREATAGCTGSFSADLTPAKAFCLESDDATSAAGLAVHQQRSEHLLRRTARRGGQVRPGAPAPGL